MSLKNLLLNLHSSENQLKYVKTDFKFEEVDIERLINHNDFDYYDTYKKINGLINSASNNDKKLSIEKLYVNSVYELFMNTVEKRRLIQKRSVLGVVLKVKHKSSLEKVTFYAHQSKLGNWDFTDMISDLKKIDEVSFNDILCDTDKFNNLHELPIFLTPTVMSNLLKIFSEVYYDADLQERYTQCVSPKVNLVDVSQVTFLKKEFIFDHYGENCEELTIYRQGKYNKFFEDDINKKGRKFLNKENYNIEFSPIHLIISPDNNDIVNEFETDKILINKIYGLNSGINLLNGDFNVLADGEIHKNKNKYLFKSVIINDNWVNILKNVDKVYSDFKLIDRGQFGSPTVRIKKMTIKF